MLRQVNVPVRQRLAYAYEQQTGHETGASQPGLSAEVVSRMMLSCQEERTEEPTATQFSPSFLLIRFVRTNQPAYPSLVHLGMMALKFHWETQKGGPRPRWAYAPLHEEINLEHFDLDVAVEIGPNQFNYFLDILAKPLDSLTRQAGSRIDLGREPPAFSRV